MKTIKVGRVIDWSSLTNSEKIDLIARKVGLIDDKNKFKRKRTRAVQVSG